MEVASGAFCEMVKRCGGRQWPELDHSFMPCRCRPIRFPVKEECKLPERLLHSNSNSAMSGSGRSATARRQINSTTLSEDDLHPNPLLRTNPDPNFRSQNRRVVFCPSRPVPSQPLRSGQAEHGPCAAMGAANDQAPWFVDCKSELGGQKVRRRPSGTSSLSSRLNGTAN